MSTRKWSTIYERSQLSDLYVILRMNLEAGFLSEESISSSDEDSASLSSTSTDTSSSLSSSSEEGDDESSSSSSSDFSDLLNLETVKMICETRKRIASSIADPTIVFGQRMQIQDCTDSFCLFECRFRKKDLQALANHLWPRMRPFFKEGSSKARILQENRYTAPFETCMLIYLFRLAKPRTLRPLMEQCFGMQKSHISSAIHAFSQALYKLSSKYLLDAQIWSARMPLYAQAVFAKVGLLPDIWGFIDGTVRRICRPTRFQRRVYTRYKKCHAIKFQSVVVPDGYIAHLTGPFVGARHDAGMLLESELIDELKELMPNDGGHAATVYRLYGDCAYPVSNWLAKGFVNPEIGSPESQFNKEMSSARVAVEWGFHNVLTQWSYLDFARSMRIFLEPTGQFNAAFLQNLRTCFYGNQINAYFGLCPLSCQQYLQLPDEL